MKYQLYIVNLCCCCLLVVMLCFFLSCKKSLQLASPIDKITATDVFSNDETATAAVLGIYSQMHPTFPFFSSGGTTIYTGLMADELYKTNTIDNEELEFEQDALTSVNSIVGQNFWLRAYRHIYHANACIEKLNAPNGVSPAVQKQLLGECLFIRAFIHFYLLSYFGDVPLITTTDYKLNAAMGRTAVAEVYQQVTEDLLQAKELLTAAYPSPGKARINKWAATALLARVYLYRQDWVNAETEASLVINSGAYTLLTALNTVFIANSDEAIWQLMPVEEGFNTTEARSFIPTTSATTRPAYPLTQYLVNAFEPNDARRTNWVGTKTVAGQPYYYPFKYKVRNTGLPLTEYYMMLRYAEQFLIRAEARAQQNKIAGALADLNTIRSRAGLSSSAANDKPSLLMAVEQERRIELFAEWGHRWFDLKRTGRATAVLSPIKTGWQPTGELFPIPQAELLNNPALTQNPGY